MAQSPRSDAASRLRAIDVIVAGDGGCTAAEPFALMVLGASMAPEFVDGDIVVVEPEGLATAGAYVVAKVGDEWLLRELVLDDAGWALCARDGASPAQRLPDLSAIRGVVIQRNRRRPLRSVKRYVP